MNTEHTPGPWCWDDKDALPWTDYDKTDHMPYLIDANGRIVMSGEDIRINNAANARLITAAPDLLAALKIQHECGMPEKSLLYYEEWVEGWRWVHPDGREWEVVGDWCRSMPYHPIVAAAIAKAEGITQNQQP